MLASFQGRPADGPLPAPAGRAGRRAGWVAAVGRLANLVCPLAAVAGELRVIPRTEPKNQKEGRDWTTETNLLRRTAAVDVATHCFPKAVVRSARQYLCGPPRQVETLGPQRYFRA